MWSWTRNAKLLPWKLLHRPLIAVVDDGDDDGAGQSAEPRWFNFAISISVCLFFSRPRPCFGTCERVRVCVRFLVCTSAGSYCAYGRLSPSGSSRSESSQTGRIRRTSQDLPLVESAWDIHTVVRTCPGVLPNAIQTTSDNSSAVNCQCRLRTGEIGKPPQDLHNTRVDRTR